MFLSFGPQPNQYRAYADLEGQKQELRPGTTGQVTDVVTFYRDTRARSFRATYTLLSSVGPLVAFVATIWLLASLLAEGGGGAAGGLIDEAQAPSLPIGAFCSSPEAHGALLNAAFAQTVRFSATHIALIAVCALAFVVGAASTLNVLGTHGRAGVGRGARSDAGQSRSPSPSPARRSRLAWRTTSSDARSPSCSGGCFRYRRPRGRAAC